MEKLLLKRVTNADLLMFNVLAEQYHAWSNHINNFRSHLDMHLLLMYYQWGHVCQDDNFYSHT